MRTESRACAQRILIGVFLTLFVLVISSCKNALSESALKTSDEALMYEARRKIDEQDYSSAILLIETMTDQGYYGRDAQNLLASAHAGACGLNLISLAESLTNASGQTLFNVLVSSMRNGTPTKLQSCKDAETTLLGISSTASGRTVDENVLMAFVEFAKIGTILSIAADADANGNADPSFDSCSSAALSDTYVGEIGTGITISLSSIQASGSSVASSVTGTIEGICNSIDAYIAALGGPFAGYSGFCNQTQPSDFDATELKVFRTLTRSNEVGLATCTDTFNNCLCMPFP